MRVMTYNVHSCVGTDGRLDEGRIASVISTYSPDVIALQELDAGRSRTKGLHQARHIADLLKMEFHFHPALRRVDEEYGDAIISRIPMTLVRSGILPTSRSRLAFEPRGALLVKLETPEGTVHLLNTHLGLSWSERKAQASALLSSEWLSEAVSALPFIFCGDLNALPSSLVHRMIQRRLKDTQLVSRFWPLSTFPSSWPLIRLDYIFINEHLQVTKIEVPRTAETKLASDHLPLIADVFPLLR